MERSISVKMFRVRLSLRLRPRFCRRQSTDYQQFGDRETLTISMWSTDGAGAGAGGTGGGTGGNYGLLTQMGRCRYAMYALSLCGPVCCLELPRLFAEWLRSAFANWSVSELLALTPKLVPRLVSSRPK
jgi:hypothetical protein